MISEHEPRKGTETMLSLVLLNADELISEHEPRKGTETLSGSGSIYQQVVNFRTRTPKGDGNPCARHFNIRLEVISEHEPRKGTETTAEEIERYCPTIISEHEPRKGTETWTASNPSVVTVTFQNTNPERGRKQYL